MDALLTTFLAALLGEFGDKTQALAVLLGLRYARQIPVIAGIAVAALANSAIASAGAVVAAGFMPFRATTLLLALALALAGLGALLPSRAPKLETYARLGAFGSSLFAFFVLEFGDKTQFLTFALAARSGEPALAAAGATLGIVAASVPAVLAGPALQRRLPPALVRRGIAILFLLVAAWAAVDALRLA